MTVDKLQAWTKELQGRVNLVKRNEGERGPIPKKSERQLAREAAEAAKAAAIEEQEREETPSRVSLGCASPARVCLSFISHSDARVRSRWRVTIQIR